MKRFRNIVAAALTICLVQGVWAVSPGGALGGGGKSAQQHPEQENMVKPEPVQAAGAAAAELIQVQKQDQGNANTSTAKPKVEIGKSTEGQAGDEFGDRNYAKVAAEHAAKKETRRQLKEAFRQYREAVQKKSPDSNHSDDQMILYVILAILLPPLAVALYLNGITTEFWICLLLTILFYLPGLIYALWVILK